MKSILVHLEEEYIAAAAAHLQKHGRKATLRNISSQLHAWAVQGIETGANLTNLKEQKELVDCQAEG